MLNHVFVTLPLHFWHVHSLHNIDPLIFCLSPSDSLIFGTKLSIIFFIKPWLHCLEKVAIMLTSIPNWPLTVTTQKFLFVAINIMWYYLYEG